MIAHKYKLRPSPQIARTFVHWLDICRELYNAALQERRDAYQKAGVSLNYFKQNLELPAVKEVRPDVAAMHSQVTQDVLRRVGRSFDNFFRRVKNGEKKVGYPRFQGQNRYDSFTYPQGPPKGGFQLRGKRLYLSKIGNVRVFLSRPIEGKIKTCTIKREADGWYAIFTLEESSCPYIPTTGQAVGVDVGLSTFATLSTGEEIPNPRYLRKAERKLKTAQRRVSRRQRGSTRRKQTVQLLAKAHQKVTRQRQDFFHKTALGLIQRFDTIAVEDLNIAGMVRHPTLSKSISDASWGTFLSILSHKVAKTGREMVKINPRGTSQTCLCGASVPKMLKDRWHSCSVCGLSAPRDHVSALLILSLAGTPPVGRDSSGSPVELQTYSPPSENPAS